jgi:D-amino-acid dehydrogenase
MQALPRPDRVWSGDRPVSLLGRPIISESPIKGLWVNSGHGHMGWTLSMASGELIAQMIFDGQSAPAFSWPNIDA